MLSMSHNFRMKAWRISISLDQLDPVSFTSNTLEKSTSWKCVYIASFFYFLLKSGSVLNRVYSLQDQSTNPHVIGKISNQTTLANFFKWTTSLTITYHGNERQQLAICPASLGLWFSKSSINRRSPPHFCILLFLSVTKTFVQKFWSINRNISTTTPQINHSSE